jgi:hypothetical protein
MMGRPKKRGIEPRLDQHRGAALQVEAAGGALVPLMTVIGAGLGRGGLGGAGRPASIYPMPLRDRVYAENLSAGAF